MRCRERKREKGWRQGGRERQRKGEREREKGWRQGEREREDSIKLGLLSCLSSREREREIGRRRENRDRKRDREQNVFIKLFIQPHPQKLIVKTFSSIQTSCLFNH